LAVTPKRADATCFTALRLRSPFASGLKRFFIFAAFTGVGFSSDAIHGDGQSLVGFFA